MRTEWLRRKLSVQQAEEENLVVLRAIGSEPVPFGFNNSRWRQLLARMTEGDEVWEFRSSESSWGAFQGRAGIALLRSGEVVDAFLTSVS